MFFYVFDVGFNKPSNTDFRTNFDLSGRYLAIIAMTINVTGLLHLTITACSWRIVVEHVKWSFAGMKAAVATTCLFLFILLADFILESTASHVLIKSFISFHFSLQFFPSPTMERVDALARS